MTQSLRRDGRLETLQPRPVQNSILEIDCMASLAVKKPVLFRDRGEKKGKHFRAKCRSWDLRVMGPARFHCATLNSQA